MQQEPTGAGVSNPGPSGGGGDNQGGGGGEGVDEKAKSSIDGEGAKTSFKKIQKHFVKYKNDDGIDTFSCVPCGVVFDNQKSIKLHIAHKHRSLSGQEQILGLEGAPILNMTAPASVSGGVVCGLEKGDEGYHEVAVDAKMVAEEEEEKDRAKRKKSDDSHEEGNETRKNKNDLNSSDHKLSDSLLAMWQDGDLVSSTQVDKENSVQSENKGVGGGDIVFGENTMRQLYIQKFW